MSLVITNNIYEAGHQLVTVRHGNDTLYRGIKPEPGARTNILVMIRGKAQPGDGQEDLFNAAMDALDKPIDHVEDENEADA